MAQKRRSPGSRYRTGLRCGRPMRYAMSADSVWRTSTARHTRRTCAGGGTARLRREGPLPRLDHELSFSFRRRAAAVRSSSAATLRLPAASSERTDSDPYCRTRSGGCRWTGAASRRWDRSRLDAHSGARSRACSRCRCNGVTGTVPRKRGWRGRSVERSTSSGVRAGERDREDAT